MGYSPRAAKSRTRLSDFLLGIRPGGGSLAWRGLNFFSHIPRGRSSTDVHSTQPLILPTTPSVCHQTYLWATLPAPPSSLVPRGWALRA